MSLGTGRVRLADTCIGRLTAVFFGPTSGQRTNGPARQPWLDDLSSGSPLLLPHVAENGRVVWYALAPDRRGLQALEAYLSAFLGPPLSTYRGGQTPLDLEVPHERALSACCDYVLRVDTGVGDAAAEAEARLTTMRSVLAERPERLTRPARQGSDILRDLEGALRLGDYSVCRELHREAQASGHFSSRNLTFLDLLVLATAGDWTAVLAHPRLASVIALPRPSRVTQAVIKAIYAEELGRFRRLNDPEGAVAHFRRSIWPLYRGLFSTRVGIWDDEARICFLLKAIVATPPQIEVATAITETLEPKAEYRDWALALLGTLPQARAPQVESARVSMEQAWDALRSLEVDHAWELGLQASDGVDRVNLLCQCALNSWSIERTRIALEIAREVIVPGAEPTLDRVLRQLERSISSVEVEADAQVPPDGWLTWADRMARDELWPDAPRVADQGAEEWPVSDLLGSAEACSRFVSSLEGVSNVNLPALRASLPHLLRALDRCEQPTLGLRRVYDWLSIVLFTDEAPGYSYFATVADLVERIINAGVTVAEYKDLMDEVARKVAQDGSPSVVGQLMDLLDILLAVRCPVPESRRSVAAAVLSKARGLDAPQLRLLRTLVIECGLAFPTSLDEELQDRLERESESGAMRLAHLEGKFVALYSLDEGALGRVRSVLEASVDAVKVKTFSDLASTPALKDAARNADLFVVVTRAATHAATQAIAAARPSDRTPLVYPAGKGSSSVLQALMESG